MGWLDGVIYWSGELVDEAKLRWEVVHHERQRREFNLGWWAVLEILGTGYAQDAGDVRGEPGVAQEVVREQQILQALRVGLPFLRRHPGLADPVDVKAAARIHDGARLRQLHDPDELKDRAERRLDVGVLRLLAGLGRTNINVDPDRLHRCGVRGLALGLWIAALVDARLRLL